MRPDGALLPGVDDEAAWPAHGGDELRWSFGCDLAEAFAGLNAAPSDLGQDQLLADLEALDRAEPRTAAVPGDDGAGPDAGGAESGAAPGLLGLIADALPAGPGLAAWAAQHPAEELDDADLPALAAALRKVTSWAQATELSVVAQIAARSAARDPATGLLEDGRPAEITRDAAAQVGLALTLSPAAAAWWTDLAETFTWRLPAVHAALTAGHIDLARARIITDATNVLPDDTARAVADQLLPAAGGQTYGQLRAAAARAVILADPQGAEERRQATERRARVGLYPGDHHTATLTGMNLPAVHAAAAMARLTALARAMQAAGAGGGLDLLRAHAYLGLLLSTLPPIPPRPDAPPDHDPGEDDPGEDDPGEDGPGPGGPGGPGEGGAGASGPGGSGRGEARPGDNDPDDGAEAGPGQEDAGRPGASPRGGSRRRGTGDPGTPPRPGGSRRSGSRTSDSRRTGGQASSESTGEDDSPGPPGLRPQARDPAGSGRHPGGPSPGPPGPPGPPDRSPPDPHNAGAAEARSDPLPPEGWPGDADAPSDDGVREPELELPEGYADDGGYPDYDLYDEPDDPNPIPAWPRLAATTPALGLARGSTASAGHGPGFGQVGPRGTGLAGPRGTGPSSDQDASRPARGLLELTMPWSALAHRSASPATLSRIGPVTAEQARLLAAVAATTPATRWRVILTDTHGHALAVTTIPRHATRPHHHTPTGATTGATTGLIGRITITMPISALDAPLAPSGHPLLGVIADAAARALLRLQHETQDADLGHSGPAQPATDGQGSCDHHGATPGYRPTTAIRDYITARDQTCRYPHCRQPAWHADIDHTRPYHKGGRTCPCNLGALCRTHHILKQLQGWTLTQPRPGTFEWTTPTGRTYTCEPDIHPS